MDGDKGSLFEVGEEDTDVVCEVADTLEERCLNSVPQASSFPTYERLHSRNDQLLSGLRKGVDGLWMLMVKKFGPPVLSAERVFEQYLLRKSFRRGHVYSGVEWWDEFVGPFRGGNVYVIAGYPGVGKTTLAINVAWPIAKSGSRVWYYCLDLTAEESFEVLGGHVLRKADMDEKEWTLAYSTIQSYPFFFHNPTGHLSWENHLAGISKAVRREAIDILFIDNLSMLVRASRDQTNAEGVAMSMIKSMSQEFSIPIVLIHHLRKPQRDDIEPEPGPHAMRGSGAILADVSDSFILHHPLDKAGGQTRHSVGYLWSGKPRWGGLGGKRYVRLIGRTRTYEPAFASEYIRTRRDSGKGLGY